MLEANIRFVLRWKKRTKLLDGGGEERQAWQITRGKRAWDDRWLRDQHPGHLHTGGVVAVCVTHPTHPQPRWLVVARPGGQHEPWYVLTRDAVGSVDAAWAVVLAYARAGTSRGRGGIASASWRWNVRGGGRGNGARKCW
jgi:hypothetical protein